MIWSGIDRRSAWNLTQVNYDCVIEVYLCELCESSVGHNCTMHCNS